MGLPSLVESAAVVERAAPVLLDLAVRGVVVMGLAGLGAACLRRASAAARHWVWLMGFAGMLMLPVLAGVLPGWRVLPRVGGVAEPMVVVTFPERAAPELPLVRGNEGKFSDAGVVASVGKVESVPVTPGRGEEKPVAAAAVKAAEGVAVRAEVAPKVVATAALSWSFWVVMGWVVGMIFVLGQLVLGNVSLWVLQRRCARVTEGEWPALVNGLRDELGVKQTVALLISPLRTMPMTWGVWRAKLLLPAEAAGWPAEQRRAVVLHELGHVRRWDCLTQLVAQVACAVYWFNPLVWVASRRMQVERERACDDLVLNTGAGAPEYAKQLLRSATAMPALRFVGAAVAMARPSTLEERLRAIMDARRDRRAVGVKGAAVMGVLLGAVMLPVAALRGQEAAAPVVAAEPAVATAPATRAAEGGGLPRGGGRGAAPSGLGGGRGVNGGIGGGMFSGGGNAGTQGVGEGATCSLDATIYDVRIPADQIGRLDMEALEKAASTAEGFEKALAGLGTVQPLYRANQSVRLGGDTIRINSQAPYTTNSQPSARGGTINTVSYRDIGAIFSIAGKVAAGGGMEVGLKVEMSTVTEGTVSISETVKAQLFRTATLSHKGPVAAKQPFVMMSVDGATADPSGKAVAYIARVTVGVPRGE